MPQNIEEVMIQKLEALDKKVDKIENAVSLIAVQNEKITNLSSQVNALWEKYDAVFAPDGIITHLSNFQASCPRETYGKTLDNINAMVKAQWVVIGLLLTVIGTKVLGII